MTTTPPRRWWLQFSLLRLLIVMVLLAIMIGSLSGLLRPGPTWKMVDGVSDDLARGVMGTVDLAQPLVQPMQVERDPGDAKIYLIFAVLVPMGLLVLLGLIVRAKHMWRWF